MNWIEIGLTIIGGLLTTLGIVLWFNYQRVLKTQDAAGDEMIALRKDLNDHLLDDQKTWADKDDVRISFEKLHLCVDGLEKTCNGMAVMLATIQEKLNHKTI